MKKVLAVSGGVDSVALLDWCAQKSPPEDIIVAHFDHGTRPSSSADAEFVRSLAENYGAKFVSARAELGERASEAAARAARYRFLNQTAEQNHAELFTAHHLDDVAESIAINLLRGTGWRGLVPMGDAKIHRPFVGQGWRKADVLKYAGERELHFRQDPTNVEDSYLRNRVREKLAEINPEVLQNLLELFRAQSALKEEIDVAVQQLLPKDGVYQRAWFASLPDAVALEILRVALASKNLSATRPQLANFLSAIRTYPPEKSFNLPNNVLIILHKHYFCIKAK